MENLRQIVPAENFEPTKAASTDLRGCWNGAFSLKTNGSIPDGNFALYAKNASGRTIPGVAIRGLPFGRSQRGSSLQHYNEVIADDVAQPLRSVFWKI